MRTFLAATLAALALVAPAKAGAQSAPGAPLGEAPPPPQVREGAANARRVPPGTVPLDDPAAPAPLKEQAPQPQVTTREEGGQVIQEYRINGRLYMQRVTPKHGRAYILVDNQGDGTFTRLDHPLDQQIRVPQWVLLEF